MFSRQIAYCRDTDYIFIFVFPGPDLVRVKRRFATKRQTRKKGENEARKGRNTEKGAIHFLERITLVISFSANFHLHTGCFGDFFSFLIDTMANKLVITRNDDVFALQKNVETLE